MHIDSTWLLVAARRHLAACPSACLLASYAVHACLTSAVPRLAPKDQAFCSFRPVHPSIHPPSHDGHETKGASHQTALVLVLSLKVKSEEYASSSCSTRLPLDLPYPDQAFSPPTTQHQHQEKQDPQASHSIHGTVCIARRWLQDPMALRACVVFLSLSLCCCCCSSSGWLPA